MTTTYHDAIDEMFGAAKGVFDADAVAILGYTPAVNWRGSPTGDPVDKSKLWARVSWATVTDGQASLANDGTKKLYECVGILSIQLFCPRNEADSAVNGVLLAEALQQQFRHRSVSGELWYLNFKIVELPETATDYPITVSGQVRYKTLSS